MNNLEGGVLDQISNAGSRNGDSSISSGSAQLGTPNEGGMFFLDITFPNDHQFKPPKANAVEAQNSHPLVHKEIRYKRKPLLLSALPHLVQVLLSSART